MSLTWFACSQCGQLLPVGEKDGPSPGDCSSCRAPLSPSSDAPARLQWYYAQGRQKHGPVSWQRLCELADSGTLLPTDMLLPAGTQKWLSAAEVVGSFGAAAERTVPTTPKPVEQPAGSSADSLQAFLDSPSVHLFDSVPSAVPQAVWPRVAGYQILGELGRGGMGVVYKARQDGLNRLVALKMILSGTHAGAQELARFRTEAESVARLQHPNIVQIYEIGEQEGRPFFSLEYVEGGSLDSKLDGTPLAGREAAHLMEILARAMHAAHERGIVHRDLKPANVLMTSAEFGTRNAEQESGISLRTPSSEFRVPKITDFGLAKQLDADIGATGTGTVLGTPSYMAPEQALGKGKEVGPAADIYALGAMFYELLTGRPPFKGVTAMDTLIQVMNDDPVPPTRLQSKVPRDLEITCLKCLAKEPPRRYGTAADLADDLRRYLNGEPIAARPASAWERGVKWVQRRPAVAGLIGLVVLTAILGFGGMSWKWRDAVLQTRKTQVALAQADSNLYFHRIALAQREWQSRQLGRAEELLDACDEPFRHWEWRYLKRLCHEETKVWRGHEGQVLHVAFSRDGRLLASGGTDGTARIWDAGTGAVRLVLRGHTKDVWNVAFSPDGKLLASASADRTVKLWNAATGALVLTFRGHRAEVRGVAFRPDGGLVASAAGEVLFWDPATGKVMHTLPSPKPRTHSIAFGPDGLRLATVGYSGPLEIWDLKTGTVVAVPKPSSRAIYGLAFSPNNLYVATSGADLMTRVWDLNQRRMAYELPACNDSVSSISFSPDGQRIAMGSSDQTVNICELKPGAPALVLRGHRGQVYSVAFSPDGRRLASSGSDGSIRLWNPTFDPEAITVREPDCHGLAFSPDSRTVAAACKNGKLTIRNAATGEISATLIEKTGPSLNSVAYSSDGHLLAAGGWALEGGKVTVWDLASHKPICSFTGHKFTVTSVAFSPDNRLAASGSEFIEATEAGNRRQRPGELKVWDARTGQERFSLNGHAEGITAVAFSPDNRLLASAGYELAIRIWDVRTGKEIRTLPGHSESVAHLAFSADGRLASASYDKTVKIWNLATGQELQKLRGHTKWVNRVAFSPDGKRLVSASEDGTVKLWDPERDQELLTIFRRGGSVVGLAYSPDGRRLAAATFGGHIRIWDAGP